MAEKLKQRADGRYARQVVIGLKDGKPVKKTVYGKTQAEVNKKYRQLLNEIEAGTDLTLEKMTVKQLCEQWYSIKKAGAIRPQTAAVYKTRLNKIYNAFGEMRVKDVQQTHIKVLIAPMVAKGTTSQAKATLFMLKDIFEYAVDIGVLVRNPCKQITVKHTVEIKTPLSEFEKKQLEKAELSLRDKALVYTMLYTGMRKGEALALRKDDIDFKLGLVTINKTVVDINGVVTVQDCTKTAAGNRQVPLFAPLRTVLLDYFPTLQQDVLFLNKRGLYMTNPVLSYNIRRICKQASFTRDVTSHCFRHTFISDCYEAGIPIKQIQAWVGHDDVNTTLNTYTHLSDKIKLDGSRMEEFYKQSKQSNRKSNGIEEPETLAN